MVWLRHPAVAETMLTGLASGDPGHHLEGALDARDRLQDMGFPCSRLGCSREWHASGRVPRRPTFWSKVPWLATRGHQRSQHFLPEHCSAASPLQRFPRLCQVARWSFGRTSILMLPHVFSHAPRCSSVPSALFASACGSAYLSVWPSSRLPWPPPCSVRHSGSVGSQRVRVGVCSRPGVSRGRGNV